MARKTKENALQGSYADKLLDADVDSRMMEQGDTEEGYAEYVGFGEAERDYRKIIARLEAEKEALKAELERQAEELERQDGEHFVDKQNGNPATKPTPQKTPPLNTDSDIAKTRL